MSNNNKYSMLLCLALLQSIQHIMSYSYRVNTILANKVPLKTGIFAPYICSSSKDPGNCVDRQEAWYYDVRIDRCSFFLYTGCGGNDNRFPTLESCKRTCVQEAKCRPLSCPGCAQTREPGKCPRCVCNKAEAAKICHQSQRRGSGRALQHKWSYNTKERRCIQFVYGGSGGNANNFDTKQDCQSICGGN